MSDMTALEARLRVMIEKWRKKTFSWYGASTSKAIIRLLDEFDAALAEAAKELNLDDPAPPSEEEVERVARAMFDVDLPLARTPAWSDRLVLARAAIKAMREGEQ